MSKSLIEITIVGALGRMGREIGKIACNDPNVSIGRCVEIPGHPQEGADYGALLSESAGGVKVTTDLPEALSSGGIVVTFLPPDGVEDLLQAYSNKGAGLVLGTTGLSDEQIKRVEDLSKRVPVVMSPNMSMGVNLLFHLTSVVASRLAHQFDIEIIEAHHRHKKDAPSGTAKRLGEIAAEAVGQAYEESVRHGRSGLFGERTSTEIGMHAVRGGEIVGDHTVLFAGSEERLELRHFAQSRAVFARGAVTAAKWLSDKGPGLYSMIDVLGLD